MLAAKPKAPSSQIEMMMSVGDYRTQRDILKTFRGARKIQYLQEVCAFYAKQHMPVVVHDFDLFGQHMAGVRDRIKTLPSGQS